MAEQRLAFSLSEFERRAEALRAKMAARGLDVVLVDDIDSLAWITGHDLSENLYRCCLLPREGAPVMVLRRLDEAPFRERSWIDKVDAFVDWEGAIPRLARSVIENGWAEAAIGVDLNSTCLPAGRFAAIVKALPAVRFVDFTGVIAGLRLVKSYEEIGLIRHAATIADQAMVEAIAALGNGGTDRAASAAAAAAIVRLGGDSSKIGWITAGRGWGFLHAEMSDQPLMEGDIVHLELCPRISGYNARLLRPAVIGAPSQAQSHVAAVLIGAQNRQIAAMRPGALASEVDALGREPILDAGLRDSYDNITGYMLGLYAAATPRTSDFTRTLDPKADWLLESGMVIHVYNAARGMAFSETVLVGDSGPERLTRLERRLFSVPAPIEEEE
jgi:Xaa-Pro dipeptidase